ncbi:MAG: tyrosine--tRNA ligase, partial [Firmicutes bacterium]|nr:tyrosine--tRNA ligase [Bacillota bacterium]
PLEQIEEMEKWDDARINEKKEILAHELTSLVHGREEADKAQAAARALFGGGGDDSDMPTTELDASQVPAAGIGVIDLLLACSLCPSKSEARRLITQGGLTVDEEKITAIDRVFSADQLKAGLKIRKGKKVYHKALLK